MLANLTDNLEQTAAVPFSKFGLDARFISSLAAVGIEQTFPIQAMTLPLALAGHDIIGQAKTGTGKTLGFGLPLLQKIIDQPIEPNRPRGLVVAPTRELALQVAKDLETAGKDAKLSVSACFGGRAIEPQVAELVRGVDVVVGTPGRLIDLMKQGHLKLDSVQVLVLDEADEMLDMGFLPDVERILAATPNTRQTMLFSATMPGQIISMARSYMQNPTHIRAVDPNDEGATVERIEQHVWRAHPLDKPELVGRILHADGRNLCIIFCKTKRTAQRLSDDLAERGFAVGAIHGDLGQGAREQSLRALRSGKIDVLVATDVAARGIDIEGVTHVINYECPDDEKTYLHRIGRTGRAGADGVAITLVDWADIARWQMINRELGLAFAEPIETYSNSEHVFTGLKIPAGTKGRLLRTEQTRAGLDAEQYQEVGSQKTGKSRNRNAARAVNPKRPNQDRAAKETPPQGAQSTRNRTRTRGKSSSN